MRPSLVGSFTFEEVSVRSNPACCRGPIFRLFRTLFFTLAIASVTTIAAADDHTSRPQLIDQYGNGQYFVLLDEQFAELEDGTAEAPARLTMDPYNARDFYGWHRPNVRALVKRLERTYGIQAILMTSYALPAFAAYIPKATVERLRSDRAIDVIVPVTEPTTVFTAWTDTTSGAEIIPWGKTAIGGQCPVRC